ncbi:hypothetical protein ACTXGL_04775 [Psychrobacter sp. T6-6]
MNAKSVLRKLCDQLNIELDSGSSSSNQKNTRNLGNEVINAIEQSKL